MLHGELGNRPEALRLTADVVRRWPDFMWAQSMAAAVHASAGDWKSAVQSAHKALAIDPQDQTALFVLAAADQVNGDPRAARARYAKAHPDLLGTDAAPDRRRQLPRCRRPGIGAAADRRGRPRPSVAGWQRTGHAPDAPPGPVRLRHRRCASSRAAWRQGESAGGIARGRDAGWRGPFWRYYRDIDPALASIRNEPGFKAAFADIERDMDRQRAELGAQR